MNGFVLKSPCLPVSSVQHTQRLHPNAFLGGLETLVPRPSLHSEDTRHQGGVSSAAKALVSERADFKGFQDPLLHRHLATPFIRGGGLSDEFQKHGRCP